MNLRTLVVSAILLAAPAVASAQPGYYRGAPPPGGAGYNQSATTPGGFWDRGGRLTLGISLGLGGMKADDSAVDCAGCDYNPITVGIAGHIGGMVNERLALMLELQANGQTIGDDGFGNTATLVQSAAMFAGQFWVTPQLWVKGGLGAADLQVSYNDGGPNDPIDTGTALLLGAGYELLSAHHYAVDLQGRVFVGNYRDGDGNHQLTSATIGVGMNWF